MTIKRMVKGTGGALGEVLCHDGDYLWIRLTNGVRTTGHKDGWRDYTPAPEPGDVWESSIGTPYRVIGVDEKRGLYHLVHLDGFHDGDYPAEFKAPGCAQIINAAETTVYTRRLPERSLTLRGRLS